MKYKLSKGNCSLINMENIIKDTNLKYTGELPIPSIYEPQISGWSIDSNGKTTIYPEGAFDNTEMILVTINNKKWKNTL